MTVCNMIPHLFLLIMNRFFYNLSVVLWVSDDAESIYEHYKSPGVAITDIRLRSTSDIKVNVINMVAMNLVI